VSGLGFPSLVTTVSFINLASLGRLTLFVFAMQAAVYWAAFVPGATNTRDPVQLATELTCPMGDVPRNTNQAGLLNLNASTKNHVEPIVNIAPKMQHRLVTYHKVFQA